MTGVRLSTAQVVLRAVVLVAPLLVLLCADRAGDGVPLLVDVLVLALAVATATVPGTHVSALTVAALLVAWWGWGPVSSVAVLPAAVCVVALHVAAVLAASGPVDLVPDPASVRRWVLRGGLLLAAALVAWLAERMLTPAAPAVAAGLAAVTAVVWWSVVRLGPKES